MAKTISQRLVLGFLISVCLVFLSAGTLLGQGTSGTITGVVSDPSGAVVPDAAVTVMNLGTGVDFHLKSNSAGVYSITSLIPGKYTVTVAAKGFKTYVNRNLELTVNQVLRIDAALEVGSETQTITVEAAAPLVNTEEGRLSAAVTGTQIQNMPLNGRNIYQLMQLVPGAVNSTGVNTEISAGGISTNINGARLNFNGFFLDGVSNKSLDGGTNAQPSPDFVQEFRIMTNNYSAEYGNAAGSITDVSIRSGSNTFHGSAWEYLRNDKLNARNFFDGDTRQYWRMNQFGANIGGPIKKDKLFFFGGYEGMRFRTQSSAQYTTETPAWRTAVKNADAVAGRNSVASLLYSDFAGPDPTEGFLTTDDTVAYNAVNEYGIDIGDPYGVDAAGNDAGYLGNSYYPAYTDPCFLNQWNSVGTPAFSGGPNWGDAQATANTFANILGVTVAEQAQIQTNINTVDGCGGFAAPGVQTGTMSRSDPMLGLVNAKFGTRSSGVFYNGDQLTVRMDYQGDKNRIFGRFFHSLAKDPNNNTTGAAIRGFLVPYTTSHPGAAFSFVHNFSPTLVNEFRAGYTRNQQNFIPSAEQFGVPSIAYDTGEVGFGAYSGYPQFFNENVYNYKDLVAIVAGKHSLKLGAEFKRNIENSEFNVGRASYYFFDTLYFAADLPYEEDAGINPELISGGLSHQDTNIRAWRNYELGFFVQDDWKISKNLTLNLGLRYDYYSPHVEKYGHTTNFVFGPGSSAEERLAGINCQASVQGECVAPAGDTQTPNGGFRPADQLYHPDKNNFSPRIGFAWDPFGTGKTAIRGGFAVFFQSPIFNSLSNSRWNLPYYSFNSAIPAFGYAGQVVYGPTNADGTRNYTDTPTYGGAPVNPGPGPEALGFAGNIQGWLPANPNLASLTGVAELNLRAPYVENAFFGVQHQLNTSTVLEVNWVGTFGRKLFWAENPNRVVNGYARTTLVNPCTGEDLSSPDGVGTALANPCFGTLRTWKNSVNSSYNALQVSLNRRVSQGVSFTTSYTWSHSLDFRSDWHALSSGASADWANPFGGSGYSMDPNRIFLEHGNSGFDLRQRFVASVVWELPWLKAQHGVAGKVLGGWQTNYILSLQSGFPFTMGARTDYNKDGLKNDRPDLPAFGNHYSFSNQDFLRGSGQGGDSLMQGLKGDIPIPASGTDGTLGRNTFFGPGQATVDFSLFKKIPITERLKLEFRSEFYNLFNRVNLYQPVARLDNRNFGLSQQAFDPRVIQFGLRLEF